MKNSLYLSGLIPDTLPEFSISDSEVWNSETHLVKGEHILVAAPSGKGKTSFISILYGLRKDFKGSYFINETNSKEISPAEWSKIRTSEISIVFQDLRLFSEYTVAENLLIKGRLNETEYVKEESLSMCQALGIGNLFEKKCGQLSFGERQRVAIVRALLQNASYFIMDEPFSHLDQKNTELALELILKKTKEQNAGLFITSLGSDYGWNYDRMLNL